MTVAEGGGIFVSYRRQETSHLAGRLADGLADRFGEGQVFIDVDTIEPGVDFAEENLPRGGSLPGAAGDHRPGLADRDRRALTATDEQGNRRLDDPDDIVRLEVEAALDRGVRVIPILAEGAVMPGRQNLPESLAGLVRRNALPIRHESFRSDARRLVTAIERILAPASGTAAAPSLSAAHGVRSAGNVLGAVTQTDSGPARSDADRAARFFTEAERIASSVTNQPSKASALTRIATALAATDPDRAARLLTDAEHIASSIIPGDSSKASALSYVATALAATDPDPAERIASSITNEYWKVWALTGAVEALAATSSLRQVHSCL